MCTYRGTFQAKVDDIICDIEGVNIHVYDTGPYQGFFS